MTSASLVSYYSDSAIKALVWGIWFFTYLFIIKTTKVLWHGSLTNFLCCHLSHEMTETLLTFQEQKDIPFSPSVRKRGKRRGGKKKAFEWLLIQFSIASLISSPGKAGVSEAHLSPRSRLMSPVIAQLVLLNYRPKTRALWKVLLWGEQIPTQHKLQHQDNPSPTTQQLQSTFSSAHPN